MQPLQSLIHFPEPPRKAVRSEREELIGLFVGKGIRVRAGKGFRDATARDITFMLVEKPTRDLHAFYKQCQQARSFPRYFYWALKHKSAA